MTLFYVYPDFTKYASCDIFMPTRRAFLPYSSPLCALLSQY
ncbi:hypothetical protein HMPREF1553_00319 [Porphyromonas gingivalis F0568]|nr:hypothetical protein HMPREF1553_00319 [Porphyromonas gingivalis F0568]